MALSNYLVLKTIGGSIGSTKQASVIDEKNDIINLRNIFPPDGTMNRELHPYSLLRIG